MCGMAKREQVFPRLSAKEALILGLLRGAKEMYGLELVAASDGALKRGTVYVPLGRMEEKGFIASHQEPEAPARGGLPRRLYRPTPYGRQLLAASTAMRRRLMPEFVR